MGALGAAQQRRVDHRRIENLANGTHRAPHRFQEGGAGVLHQVPAVGDLHGVRNGIGRGLAIPAATVARNHGDLRVGSQPRLDRRGFAVGQQIDDPALLQVAHQRAVMLTTLPGEVVNPDHRDRASPGRRSPAPDDPQQRIPANRQHKAAGQAGRRTAAQGDPEMMDDALGPRHAPSRARGDRLALRLSEDHPQTASVAAPEPAHPDAQVHGLTMGRKIHQAPIVATMDLSRSPAAFRASSVQANRAATIRSRSASAVTPSITKPAGDTAWNDVRRIRSSPRTVPPIAYPPAPRLSQSHLFTPKNSPTPQARGGRLPATSNQPLDMPLRLGDQQRPRAPAGWFRFATDRRGERHRRSMKPSADFR